MRRARLPILVTTMTLALAATLASCNELDGNCSDSVAIGEDATWPPVGMVHSSGAQIVDGSDAPLRLRCVNVDGWLRPIPYLISDSGNALTMSPTELMDRLDETVGEGRAATFWRDWRDRFVTEDDFARIAALGANCVRLVVYHRAIATVDGGTPDLDEAGLAHVDDAVAWAKAHRLYVVLDLHTAPGGQNAVATVADIPSTDLTARLWTGATATANQDATVALWRALATRYAGETVIAGYDLLNEPALPDGVAPVTLYAFYRRLVAALREVDPDHMVFIEGDDLAHDFSAFPAPIDDNMVYTFHAYDLTGLGPWATPEQADLQAYLDLRSDHDRPLWLGEFGEGTKAWQSDMIALMEDNDIGWALYPWKRKQTWFFNPVLQRIPDSPKWYALASWLLRSPSDTGAAPSEADALAGMEEILENIRLPSDLEDRGLADALFCP